MHIRVHLLIVSFFLISFMPSALQAQTIYQVAHAQVVDLMGGSEGAAQPEDKTVGKILKKLKKEHKEKFKTKKRLQFAAWLLNAAKDAKKDTDLAFVLADQAAQVAVERKCMSPSILFKASKFLSDNYAGISINQRQTIYMEQVASVPLFKSVAALIADPIDADANSAVGLSYCFTAGDIKNGITLMNLGPENDLHIAVTMEIADPKDSAEMMKLAEMWFDLARDKDYKAYQQGMYQWSLDWYLDVLPEVKGLIKDNVQKRIDALVKLLPVDDSDWDFDQLTEVQWDSIPGKAVTCHLGNPKNKTKIKLTDGEEIRVVPHPSEEWGVNIGGMQSNSNYEGVRMGGQAGGGRGARRAAAGFGKVGNMQVFLDDDATAMAMGVGIIAGPGEIFIGGAIPPLGRGARTNGSIRVKFMAVGVQW
ncbi:MAG: hypothetical protein HRU15_06080 [Planctomycetes bacterium]|nr:hypothetical protein [Planctomycetota bacterium]